MSSRAHTNCNITFLLQLPCDLVAHIASFLPPGEAAYSLRLSCKALGLRSKELLIVPLGDKKPPVPLHALLARWGQPVFSRGLTYKQRIRLLIDAA